jgi:hypothetical protein
MHRSSDERIGVLSAAVLRTASLYALALRMQPSPIDQGCVELDRKLGQDPRKRTIFLKIDRPLFKS